MTLLQQVRFHAKHCKNINMKTLPWNSPSISCQLTAFSAIGIPRDCAKYNNSTSNALQKNLNKFRQRFVPSSLSLGIKLRYLIDTTVQCNTIQAILPFI